jgi:hypothetical protein
MNNLFKHRFDPHAQPSLPNLVDSVDEIAAFSTAILDLLFLHYDENGSSRLPDQLVMQVLISVHHDINDIKAIVNHYYEANKSVPKRDTFD